MAHRIRVLLLIPHLGGGGAEQVMALLARGLSREKYELHLGLVTQKAVPRGDLPAWVTIHALGARRVRAGGWRVLRLVRKVCPDIVLSGMFHLNFLVLLLRPFLPRGARLLVRQNGTVSAALAAGSLPRGTRFLYRVLYRRAARVICSSRAMADDLIATLDLPPDHAVVLPNPLDVEAILAARQHPVRWPGLGPHLLAVGRLAPEKGFDLLLEAFAEVRERFPAADLVIAGSGPEQAALQTQCSRLGLEQAVHFAGHVANPYALFPGATLFVLSSRHEGMPNALLEAVAGGLPVVATPASGGVVELLRELPAAWPAPDISTPALAETLICALQTLEVGRHTHLAIVSSESPVEPDPLHASHGPAPTIRLGSSSAIAAYEELLDSIYATRQP